MIAAINTGRRPKRSLIAPSIGAQRNCMRPYAAINAMAQ